MQGEGDEAPRDKKRRMIDRFRESAYAHLRSTELLNSVIEGLKRDGLLVETDSNWIVTSHALGVSFTIPVAHLHKQFHNTFCKEGKGALPQITLKLISARNCNASICIQVPLTGRQETSLDTIATLILAVGAERDEDKWLDAWTETASAPPYLRLSTALIAVHGLHVSPISNLIKRSLAPFGKLDPRKGTITVRGSGSTSWLISLDPNADSYRVQVKLPRRIKWSEPFLLYSSTDPIELAEFLSQAPNAMALPHHQNTLYYDPSQYYHLVNFVAERHAPLRKLLIEREMRDEVDFEGGDEFAI